jgi:phage shock protein A
MTERVMTDANGRKYITTEPFKPDYNTEAVLIEEMQRMAKRIEELEAEQEPVAWMYSPTRALFDICPNDADEGEFLPLYLAPPQGDIRALKHRIHELEGELLGYKKIVANQDAMLERQTARIVELQEHIDNFDGEDR